MGGDETEGPEQSGEVYGEQIRTVLNCSSERFKQPFQYQRKPKLIKMDLRLRIMMVMMMSSRISIGSCSCRADYEFNLQSSLTSAFTQRKTN